MKCVNYNLLQRILLLNKQKSFPDGTLFCFIFRRIKDNNFRKLRTDNNKNGLQVSGRMNSRRTILKRDSKPCPWEIVQLNEEVIAGRIKELV